MNGESDGRIARLTVSGSDTISHALKRMNDLNRKLLIVEDEGRFAGLFSVGDIQRAILAGMGLSNELGPLLRPDCLVASEGESLERIRETMLRDRVEYMPVVDGSGRLVRVVFWEDLFGERSRHRGAFGLPVVVMAGGLGTRLKPLTNVIPKALVPVHEKPIIQDIVDRFAEQGASKFLVSVNYKGRMIRDFFDEIPDKGYEIEFFTESEPLGTAGSLRLVSDRLHETFAVTNCDIIVNHDYSEILEFHRAGGFCLTAVSTLKTISLPYGVIRTENSGSFVGIDEKPELSFQVNAGMYILEPRALGHMPEGGSFHITQLMERLRDSGERVGVYPVNEGSWMDMGEWGELQRMTRMLLGERKD